MIPYYILAIEDETDRAYMTALFFQYQKFLGTYNVLYIVHSNVSI